ncbi:MAG: hypothetical protein UX89_C0026G0009 [Parcubacteria group bacterium GW2011_GWA2_47_16]|nr:MAG: hypothetical protein UX89_C0026G0009 [Parcubacteria group bacterium GW2011_GWA2_47_16]
MNATKMNVRVDSTDWNVIEIQPETEHGATTQTGSVKAYSADGGPKSWKWTADYTGSGWHITGSGATLRSGHPLDPARFPFMSDAVFNIGMRKILAGWLDQNRKPANVAAEKGLEPRAAVPLKPQAFTVIRAEPTTTASPTPIPPRPVPWRPTAVASKNNTLSTSERAPATNAVTPVRALPTQNDDVVVLSLRLENVDEWALNPRRFFRQVALKTLADSMTGPSQVQPVQVRPFIRTEPDRYLTESEAAGVVHFELVDGARRRRSLLAIRAETIRAIVVYPKNRVEHHRWSVIANMHREAHSHYENACAVIFQAEAGRSVAEMAADFSMSTSWIRNYLSLRALLPEIFLLLSPEVSEREALPYNQALLLAQITKERQHEALQKARSEGGAHGPKGVLLRLRELAEQGDYRSTSAPGMGGKRRKPADTAKLVRRAVAAVQFNAASLIRLQLEFERSLEMKVPANRQSLASRLKQTAESLLSFSRALVSDTNGS